MKKRSLFLILLIFALFIGGCKYDFILPEEVPPVDNGGNPISYSTQVNPIFSTGDKCTQCHKTGGQAPDLSPANSYNQIVPKYVVAGSPETSEILTIPGSSTHSWKNYSATERSIIQTWITEGAKNN
jgi:hypothetical protein